MTAKHKGIDFSLSYDEFVRFTSLSCAYCEAELPWQPWSCGKKYSKAYFLDRKDSSKGYTIDNCVPCCTDCNYTKSNRFTHDEFLIIGEAIRTVREARAKTRD